jgi:urease accessory protein
VLKLTYRLDAGEATPRTTLTLPLEDRLKGRLRVVLDDGTEAGVFLARGQLLRDGDLLGGDAGVVVAVRAAVETLSCVRVDEPLALAKACYHLGNRHVALQIEADRLCYRHDHVLDAMLRGLGLTVTRVQAPFDPEPGAYQAGGSHGEHHAH